jgi:hypothetical protein
MKTIILMIAMLLCETAFGQASDFKPEIKIGGVIYAGWEFNVDDRNFIQKLDSAFNSKDEAFGYLPVKNQFETSQNSFYLERAYMTILASLASTVKARLTSDIYSITDGAGKTQYQLGIKFAWINWTAIKNENGFALDFNMGVIPNQWIMYNDKYYGYRSFGKTLTDFQWTTSAVKSAGSSSGVYSVNRTTSSFFPAADLGANVTLTLPHNYAEIYLNIFNGSGFRNLSFDNRFKDFEALAFIHPLAGMIKKKSDKLKNSGKTRLTGITDLTLGGFIYLGKLGLGENYGLNKVQYKRNRAGAMVNARYNFTKSGFLKLGGEFSSQFNQDPWPLNPETTLKVNSRGISVYGEFNPPFEFLNEKLMLVARYDLFDPDIEDNSHLSGFTNNSDKQSMFLLGIAYKPQSMLTAGVSYQQMGFELPCITSYNGKTYKSDSRLFIHTGLEF